MFAPCIACEDDIPLSSIVAATKYTTIIIKNCINHRLQQQHIDLNTLVWECRHVNVLAAQEPPKSILGKERGRGSDKLGKSLFESQDRSPNPPPVDTRHRSRAFVTVDKPPSL